MIWKFWNFFYVFGWQEKKIKIKYYFSGARALLTKISLNFFTFYKKILFCEIFT